MPMSNTSDIEPLCKRAAKRDSLLLMAELCDEAGTFVARSRIRNLSAKGMMAECIAGFHTGDRITCELRGAGHVQGEVTWVRNGRIGIAFDDPINPQTVRRPVTVRRAAPPGPSPVRFGRPIRHR